MNVINKQKGGLKQLPKNAKNDYKLGFVFALPPLEELPSEFSLEGYNIKSQGNTDYCSAYTSCGMSELQEGVELYPEYSFALSKELTGDPDSWGQHLKGAMQAHTKFGAIEKGLTDVRSRYLKDYPNLLSEAEKHRKQSYFKVEGQYDVFNDIRASIWKFRDKKQAVALGLMWAWSLQDKWLSGTKETGFGHAVYAIGWKDDYLKIVNSYGKEAGEQGTHYLHKDTVNYFVGRYGAYMLVDMPPEDAKKMNDRAVWYNAGTLKKLQILLADLSKLLLKL